MVAEGIDPQTVEQASSQAGYPAPVLQLLDELTLTLPQKIRKEARAAVEAAGGTWAPHPVRGGDRPDGGGSGATGQVRRRRVLRVRRRQAGAAVARPARPSSAPPTTTSTCTSSRERMLFVEAIETQKCLDEGVLTSVADANIGSIFGIGFPAWTGGVVQYVEGYPGGVGGLRGAGRRVRREVRRAVHGAGFAAGAGSGRSLSPTHSAPTGSATRRRTSRS